MDEKQRKIEEIEREIEFLNVNMKSKRFDRFPKSEQLRYINEQIKLWNKLKELAGFFDKMKINAGLVVLEELKKKIEKEN